MTNKVTYSEEVLKEIDNMLKRQDIYITDNREKILLDNGAINLLKAYYKYRWGKKLNG